MGRVVRRRLVPLHPQSQPARSAEVVLLLDVRQLCVVVLGVLSLLPSSAVPASAILPVTMRRAETGRGGRTPATIFGVVQRTVSSRMRGSPLLPARRQRRSTDDFEGCAGAMTVLPGTKRAAGTNPVRC